MATPEEWHYNIAVRNQAIRLRFGAVHLVGMHTTRLSVGRQNMGDCEVPSFRDHTNDEKNRLTSLAILKNTS
jgi:hypothetical protein